MFTTLLPRPRVPALNSTGTQRAAALLFSCSSMKSKDHCTSATPSGGNPSYIRGALCQWIDADGDGDDQFGECIKSYPQIKTLCEKDADMYGCPSDSGCAFTANKAVRCNSANEDEKPDQKCKSLKGCKWAGESAEMGTCEEDTCALNADFSREMKTCTAASCHTAGLATPKMCANYGGLCDMVEFKPEAASGDDNDGDTGYDNAGSGGAGATAPHCANIVVAKPSCSDKCDEDACLGEPTLGFLTCDWAPANGQCKPAGGTECYEAMDKAGCDKLKGCTFQGTGDEGQCEDGCAAAETKSECDSDRDCKYEAENVCKLPKCDDYSNEGECNKHIIDSTCYWGVPGSCSINQDNEGGDSGDGSEYEKCAAIMDYDDCKRDTTCSWQAPISMDTGGGDYSQADDEAEVTTKAPDTTKKCFKQQAKFNCRGLDGKSACNGQKVGNANVCIWSAPTTIPEVVCFDKGFYDQAGNDICDLPNDSGGSLTTDGRDWGAQAYADSADYGGANGGDGYGYGGSNAGGFGGEGISMYTTIEVDRGTKCRALEDKGCTTKADWPFTDDRSVCLKGEISCDKIPFEKVCSDHSGCEWNKKMRGLAGYPGACVDQGTADPRECADKVCPENCNGSCEWNREWGGGSPGQCYKKGEAFLDDGYVQKYESKTCADYGFYGEEYTTSCECVDGCSWVGNNRAGLCLPDADVPKQDDCDAINPLFDFKNGGEVTIDGTIKLALEDACYSVGYKDGKSSCKVVIADMVPFCQKADAAKITCSAYGRGTLDGSDSGCVNAGCEWCEGAYYDLGKGCYDKDQCPTSTSTQTTSTVTASTSSTSTNTASTTTASTTTTITETSVTSTTVTETSTTITTTTTETTTTMAMDAITLSWDNPMCKQDAVPTTPSERAAKASCKTGLGTDDVGANDENKILSVSLNMVQGKACAGEKEGSFAPCINTNKRCVTTECTKNRDALNKIAYDAIVSAVKDAKNVCDPRTMWKKNSGKPEGEEGWESCSNFNVGDLTSLSMDAIEWAWSVKDQTEGSTAGNAQGTIQWIAKIDVGSPASAATLRTIMGTAKVDILEVFTAEFKKAASNQDSLIVQKFEKVAKFIETSSSFAFGPGLNSKVGLDRAPGAIRFGAFVDDGDAYVYTTPAPNDEVPAGTGGGGGGGTDDYDSTDGKFTMDEINDFPQLPAAVAKWNEDCTDMTGDDPAECTTAAGETQCCLVWTSEYALTKPTLRSADDAEGIGSMVTILTQLTADLGQMATEIDKAEKTISQQTTTSNKEPGVQEALELRKQQLRDALAAVKAMKTYADSEIKGKDFELKILASGSTDGGGDAASGDKGTLIGVIVAIVVVLGMAGAVAFLVVKKNSGSPKQYRNHPTTQQNPAYEAPRGGPAGAQKGGAAKPKQNVQQQGQRKVLVLDPYGNDA